MDATALLEKLVSGRDLDRGEAAEAMRAMIGSELPEAVVAGLLVALRAKGASAEELAGFAGEMRACAVPLRHAFTDLIDTCGTGGGKPSFNLSTGAAIVAAAAGARVAKHGNRAVTSRCGSADVLEALGVRIGGEPELLQHLLEQVGLVFLFAPAMHPAVKSVAPVRKALGVRTVFNQLGPLANPAGAHRQVVGVYALDLARPMAEALRLLGSRPGTIVVHGSDGLDEVTPCGDTRFARVVEGGVEEGSLRLSDFGLDPLPEAALEGGQSVAEGAAILRRALTDPSSAASAAMIPSAAVAIHLAGIVGALSEAARIAREAIASGAAWRKLEHLVEASAG